MKVDVNDNNQEVVTLDGVNVNWNTRLKWRFARRVSLRIANDEESVRRMKEKRQKQKGGWLGRQVATADAVVSRPFY